MMPSTQTSSSTSRSGSSSRTAMVPGMMAYSERMLGLNMQNYENILSGHAQGQQMLAGTLNRIYEGYGDIESRVMNMLGVNGGGWGVATPAANAIRQGATRTQGQTQQQMINAGLGNTSVMGNLTNQNQLQTNQAYGELGSKLADYAAGYTSQIGLARQQSAMQGAGLQAQMENNYVSTLGGYQFRNTVGDLTGQFSNSWSQGSSQSQGMSAESPMMGSRGGGGGRMNGGNFGVSQPSYDPYTPRPMGDLTAVNYGAARPSSFSYGGGGNVLNLSGGYGGDWAGMTPTQAGGGYGIPGLDETPRSRGASA
jgi:hypothetical protein